MICVLQNPLTQNCCIRYSGKYKKILTVEDGCLMGGFGSAVVEFMADNSYTANVVRLVFLTGSLNMVNKRNSMMNAILIQMQLRMLYVSLSTNLCWFDDIFLRSF